MIAYYIHHHGRGHVTRATGIARRINQPVVGLSSLDRPADWPGEWVQLPLDLTDEPIEPTAGGVLHWAPLHHDGYRQRMQLIARAVEGVDLLVADVSVEVALLARLLGVPTVVLAMRGERTDLPHRLAYDSATRLIAPWSAEFPETWWPDEWTGKTCFTGAFSRFDDHPSPEPEPPGQARRVLVVLGAGGSSVGPEDIRRYEAATPGWQWELRGPDRPSPDLWNELRRADVVVTHGGNNAVAEVAAARRPAVVVAEDRPFREQHATVAALRSAELCETLDTWPEPDAWPGLLTSALARGGDQWARWNPGDGLERAARALDEWAATCGRAGG